jgi:hypothetical protein
MLEWEFLTASSVHIDAEIARQVSIPKNLGDALSVPFLTSY